VRQFVSFLDCSRLLQQAREILLLRLQLRVAADVLLVDEDVRNGALGSDVLEGILDGSTII
jgi:hypothetical protein